ncbi:MAG: amidohydrolase family protein, partial [Gammaproteobacteria bacterium]|nr:amidohydrolase family protein [Gammaproteobacteria bacterium]
HCLHVQEEECRLMAESGAAAAHCPTSNMFLGSGLFDLRRLREWQIRVGLGTDVGGGTSLSLLKTMREAYKVLHLQQQPLPPGRALYLATLGAAQALYLDNRIGNFETGKEADFIVLDPRGTSISAHRTALARSPDELLFALIVLGDDRNVAATYLQGLPA